MKRALRRWKKLCKAAQRKRNFKEAWGEHWGWHPMHGETPTPCSCSMCSNKNSWSARSERRRMRDGERGAIREFYENTDK